MKPDTTPSPESQDCLEYIDEYIDSLPPALRPIYATPEPNQSIALYTGPLQITQEINQHIVEMYGHGSIEFAWFPQPCIKFEFLNNELAGWIDITVDCFLTFLELKTSVRVNVSRFNQNTENLISGTIIEPLNQGSGEDLVYVLFHVANFHNFIGSSNTILIQDSRRQLSRNRITFEVESWRLTLDQLETTKSNVDLLNSTGGFAVTHVGKLEKSDGEMFSGGEARAFLDGFADFLSFARGFRVPLVLLSGFDALENQTWKYWDSSIGHSWRGVRSWFPTQDAGRLADVFPGFLRWWQDWEKSEKIALYWYLEANASLVVEQQIILVQVALELIAYKQGHTQGPAHQKLKGLLAEFGISLNVPPDKTCDSLPTFADAFKSPLSLLEHLQRFKQTFKETEQDGAYVFTRIRNDIVHARKEHDLENFSLVKHEACDLGLWYLELVLLRIFDYQGIYASRLQRIRYNGETELVPWALS